MGVVARSLRKVEHKLKGMEKDNKSNMEKFPHLNFEELPDPYSQPEKIKEAATKRAAAVNPAVKFGIIGSSRAQF